MRALLLLLLLPLVVVAGETTLTWTNPTDTESCSPAGAYTNPGGTKIFMEVADIPDPDQLISSHTLPGLLPGTYRYMAVSYTTDGVLSRTSGEAEKVITDFVTTGTTVFYVVQQPGTFVLLSVGSIPTGVPCDVTQEVNGKYAVPTDQVTWTGTVRPLVVVAECG